MRAVEFQEYGGPEVLKVVRAASPNRDLARSASTSPTRE